MGISRQTPASCYVVSADVLLAQNLNTKVGRHFQTANKLQDHQLSVAPAGARLHHRGGGGDGWNWGKKNRMIRSKRWENLADWNTVLTGGEKPDRLMGPQTDNIWWSGWRTQLLYTREGRKQRGTGEAEQTEETRAIRKVREPMNKADRHEWKRQKKIHATSWTKESVQEKYENWGQINNSKRSMTQTRED